MCVRMCAYMCVCVCVLVCVYVCVCVCMYEAIPMQGGLHTVILYNIADFVSTWTCVFV